MMKFNRVTTLFLAVALVLSACSLPNATPTQQINPNAVFTAAAQTVVVQLTQNALLIPSATVPPPTSTITITDTPQPPAASPTGSSGTVGPATSTSAPAVAPTSACDAAQFVSDVTIPDGTSFAAGATFTKTWRLKNIGTCTWSSSYALVFDSGEAMGGAASQPLSGTTAPGATVDVSVNLQAPSKDGTYRGFWGVSNASGARLSVAGGSNGKSFYVEIKVGTGVGSGTVGPTTGPVANPTDSTGKFAVIAVSFNVTHNSESCSSASAKYTVTATITANRGGTVTYTWVPSESSGPSESGTLTFDHAGSQTITTEWVTTLSSQWVELYVDKPNHQQFGTANLNCS
jgi:hypothetical protein